MYVHRWQHFTLYSCDVVVMKPHRQLRDLAAPMLLSLTLAPDVANLDSDDELDEVLRNSEVASLDSKVVRRN